MTWWDTAYPYRRDLSITSNYGLPVGHPMTCTLTAPLVSQGKVKSDFSDIAVTFQQVQIPCAVTSVANGIQIVFPLQANLSALVTSLDYNVYYGDKTAAGALQNYVAPAWPVQVDPADPVMSYTYPGKHWINGVSQEDGGRATFTTDFQSLQVVVNADSKSGIAEISLDGGSWQECDCYSSTPTAKAVYTVTQQTDSVHTLQIRQSGRRNPRSSANNVSLNSVQYAKAAVAQDLGEELSTIINWASTIGGH